MDRERKLLYTIAILAPIVEGLMFAAYNYQSDLPSRTALLEEARDCNQRLIRTYEVCLPKLRHSHGKGI